MPKHYVYRIDHDVNFAPNVDYGVCSLCGCMPTIEANATAGSWIIGIGGNNTGKRDMMIYAMEVEGNPTYSDFRKRYPRKSEYLQGIADTSTKVLHSRKYYYFGDNAITLPDHLQHVIFRGRNCKCLSEEAINQLKTHLCNRRLPVWKTRET